MSQLICRRVCIALLVLAGMASAIPAAAQADFYTVPGCRVYDSRIPSDPGPDGPLDMGTVYTVSVAGTCGVPADATAVALNVTVIGANKSGFLAVFPAGTTPPFVEMLAFKAGRTQAVLQMVGLSVDGDLSFEANPSSAPPPPPQYHFVIDVIGYYLNLAPTDIALDNNTVAEGQPAGTLVGNLSTTDPDAGDSHTYSLVSGTGDTDNALFQISGNQLQTAAVLDFEAQSSYSVRIRSTDSGGLFIEEVFTITATAGNDPPTDITLSNSTVAENQPSGTVVGTFTTTDQDAGDTFTYTLVAGTGDTDNASFAIVGDQLQTAAVLDFEAQPSYSIRVRSTDAGGLFFEEVFTITATNENEAPTDIALSPTTVAEGQPAGTTVGTFSTTDPDAGDTFTYTLVAGTGDTDNASFAIVGNQLQTTAVFDIETKSSYSIRVRSTDAGGLFFEEVFTITVTNVNEAPTDIALSPSAVDENQAAGTTVGTFTTTDPDAGDTFTYTLVAGAGDTDNASFAIVGDLLQTAAVFDFETKSSYSIRVRSTDAGGLFFEEVFTITVNNVNEAPTDIALDNATLAEGQPVGTPVGNFSTTDPDAGDTFTYTLVAGTGDTDNGLFTIVGNQLRTNAILDFETKSSYSIRVRSTDAGGLFIEEVFTITVTNVNEAPTDIALSPTAVNEGQPAGTTVGTFTTTDPDAGDTFTYTLVAGAGSTDNASFAIVGNQLQTAAVFDFETKSSYSIRVRSTDAGGLFFEEIFTITVNNVNEAPTDIALSPTSVNENQPINTPVGNFTTTDPDTGDTFTYTLVAGTGDTDNGMFTIVGNQLRTNAVFDFETKSSYSIRVRSTDAGGLFFEEVFTITINNVNEAPTDIALSPTSVNENEPINTAVGNFSTTDPDAGDTFTYTLVAGAGSDDNASFNILGNQLRTSVMFNFEAKSSYTIRVRSTDSGGLFVEEAFTITIINVPEAPIAGNDAYDTVGNTLLEVDASDSEPAPKIYFNGNVLNNDVDPDGPTTLTVSLVSSTPGAVVTLNPNGTFTYLPPAGATGTDTFTYNVSDGILTSAVPGTVTITLKHRVWYVKNDHPAGGLGRSTDPFNTLIQAETASAAGDTIHVYAGDGTTLNHTAGIALKANQRLIGEGVQLDVPVSVNGGPNPQFLRAAGSQPLLDRTGGTGESVRVNNVGGVEIRGLSLAGNANAIDITTTGGNSGGAVIRNNTFRSAGAEGIDANAGGTGAMTLDIQDNNWNVAGTHTGNAVDIARTAGTVQLNFSNNANIVSAATAVNITGGSTTITGFSGNTVHQNTGGTGINVNGATFDQTPGGSFQTVSGGTTVVGIVGNGVGGSGIVLTSVAGDLSFANLQIVADNGAGLRASGTTAYTGSAGFQVTIANTAVTKAVAATGGPAIDLATVSANLPSQNPVATQMTVTSANSATTGVALNSVTGVFSAGTGSSITNITSGAGTAFQVGSSNVTVSYAGTITNTNGKGVDLTSNTGSTISFSGALTLTSGTNTAFNATGGGTVTATDTTNTLTTTTATALNVANTTIGAGGLRFRSISSGVAGGSGPVNGINLNNTGSSGGLTVSGNGGTCTFATPTCTGGTIQSSSGDAVRLVSTRDVSLTRMRIHDNDTNGIYGDELTNFTLANSVVSDNDVANPSAFEAGIKFNELYGTSSITDTVVRGTKGDNIRLEMASGTLNSLTLANATVGPTANVGGGYSNGFSIVTTGTPTLNVTVTNSLFTGVDALKQQSSGILTSIGGGTTTLTVTGSDFEHENIGIDLGSSSTGTHRFNIDNNDVIHHRTNAVNIVGSSVMNGTINNNRVGNGTADSGSMNSFGIAASHRGNANWALAITNNTVRNSDFEGIFVRTGDLLAGDSGTVNLTLTGNTVFTPDDNSGFPANPKGMHLRSRQATTLCMNIANNEAQGAGAAGYHLQESDTSSLRFQDFNTNAVTTLTNKNNKTGGGAPTTNEVGAPFAGGCTPTLPSFP